MKHFFLILLCLLVVPLSARASLFGPGDDEEITPLQYSALLGLRDLDPVLFRTKLLPLIEEAMKDGRITVKECRDIERAAGNVAGRLLQGGSGTPLAGQLHGNHGQGAQGRP